MPLIVGIPLPFSAAHLLLSRTVFSLPAFGGFARFRLLQDSMSLDFFTIDTPSNLPF